MLQHKLQDIGTQKVDNHEHKPSYGVQYVDDMVKVMTVVLEEI